MSWKLNDSNNRSWMYMHVLIVLDWRCYINSSCRLSYSHVFRAGFTRMFKMWWGV